MDVGIFQLVPSPDGSSDRAAIEQALWEADFAEASGFDAVWIAEHHLSSFGLVGAPSVYAAAISQRTRRVDIGYGVAVVPLHHPARLAEEIAWLTHLSGGRVLVGLGPGFSPFEFAAFGVPLEERHERLEEGAAVVRGLLAEATFSHRGKHWTLPPVTLRPRPFAVPPLLRASSGPESLRRAAEAGQPVLLGLKPFRELEKSLESYRSIRGERGVPARDIDREIAGFRVLRRVVVAESDREALADARSALAFEAETARRVHGGEDAPATPPVEISGGCVGSPEAVLDGLRALSELGIRHVIAWMNFGDLAHSKIRRSMELLASEVLPRLSASARQEAVS